jgi:hypothetical protein
MKSKKLDKSLFTDIDNAKAATISGGTSLSSLVVTQTSLSGTNGLADIVQSPFPEPSPTFPNIPILTQPI